MKGRISRNGCIENCHFALQRCDWLEHLREYAASKLRSSASSTLSGEKCMLFSQMSTNQIAGKQSGNLCKHSEICWREIFRKGPISASWQHSYEKTTQQWRAVGDTTSDLTDPGFEPQTSRTDKNILATELAGRSRASI